MTFTPHSASARAYLAGSVDMADIGSDTRCATDVVKAELSDKRVRLEEKREGLSDSSSGTEDGDLRQTRC